jgi:Protein of unknown function (DUF3072)
MSVEYPNEVPRGVARYYSRGARTGDDPRTAPMTLSQASYLMMLCEEIGETFDDAMTQSQAAALITRIEDETGRRAGAHGG